MENKKTAWITAEGKREFRNPKVHPNGAGCNSLLRVDRESRAECIFPADRRAKMRHRFQMSVGAHPGGVGEVSAAFAEFAADHELSAGVRRSVSVALDELLANTLSHGRLGSDASSVTVEMELDQERVTVIVTDDGPPFDPFGRDAPDTTLSVEERSVGGLGIHLVRQLMDNVSYQRREGRNVVILVKQL